MATLSKYQTAIIDFVRGESRSLQIQAVAGSGKTSTILQCNQPNSLFLAFNKSIATELQQRGVNGSTFNSLGHRMLPKCRLDAWKTYNHCKSFGIKEPFKYAKIISLTKAYNGDVDTVCKVFDLEKPEYFDKVWESVINDTKTVDFDDQIFMPVHYGYNFPKYDIVFVDESQDLNPIQIEFLARMKCRIVSVGDTYQAIYGFRGADSSAMASLRQRFDMAQLPLSISYRCSKAVVKEAQKIVSHIEPWEHADEGIVGQSKTFSGFVLCRVTAPLIKNCLRDIRDGKNSRILGKEIGKDIVKILEGLPQYDISALEDWYTSSLTRVRDSVTLSDKYETLQVIMESCPTLNDAKNKIETLFSDDKNCTTKYMTIHKSKGLESDVVYLLEPQLLPHPNAKLDWQQVQESNLKYVAVTRAKKEFYYVK